MALLLSNGCLMNSTTFFHFLLVRDKTLSKQIQRVAILGTNLRGHGLVQGRN